MAEHTLTILHISDLHQRKSLDWRRRRVLGDAWTTNLDAIKSEWLPDLVCFTGDAAFAGKPEEYEQATKFFSATLERLDLDWDRARQPRRRSRPLAGSLGTPAQGLPEAGVVPWLTGSGPRPRGFRAADLEAVLKRQGAYREWMRTALRRTALSPAPSPSLPSGYRQTLRLHDFPFEVHVLGLDSAWLCGDENDSSHLLLSDDQVMSLATGESARPLDGFRLGLVHHPLDDLADAADVRPLLAEHIDLLLRGHLHVPEAQTWSDPERQLRQVVAGCLYENHRYRNAFECIAVKLDDGGRVLSYRLWFRGWSKDAHWTDDDSIYRGTIGGRLTVPVAAAPDETTADLRVAHVFVGREPELEQLELGLLSRGGALPVAICAVQGMPGVGKSYLAERFLYLYRQHFPGGVFRLVLDPEERAATRAGSLLGVLAERLHRSPAAAGLAERVRDRLLQPLSLLHVENVDTESAAQAVARLIGWLPGCPALVTGRYQDLGESYGWRQVRVRPFSKETALAQLQKELGEDSSQRGEDAHRHLVQALGFLPLAVHLAAGHLRAGRSARGFLDLLRQTALALPPANAAERGLSREESRIILSRTFDLSLDCLRDDLRRKLGDEGNDALAGFFDLGHAPLSGFGASLGTAISGLALAFEDLMVMARGFSMLELIPASATRDRTWRLHPLLAELLRLRGGEAGERRALARMTDWFSARLPDSAGGGEQEEQGRRWKEIHEETLALISWLGRVPEAARARVAREGSLFAILNGPFHAWSTFCESLLAQELTESERSDVLWTLGKVSFNSGAIDRALAAAREQEGLDRGRGADRDAALAVGLVADVLLSRGEMEEALRIRREEQLPVYERLGDARECAGAMSRIADVMQLQGDLGEALHIYRQAVVPVYERLGDVRSRALTMGKIAGVLEARGELNEALRIRREEELPVYEPLGDVRSQAVTKGKIAETLEALGDLDEALRLRREEQLPAYERMGALRESAATMGQIAELLRKQGDLPAALRILEEQIPIYERMSLRRELIRGRASLALIYLARNTDGDREAAARLLYLALESAVAIRVPQAEQIRALLRSEGLPLEPRAV